MALSGNFSAFNATVQPQRDRVNHQGPPTLSTRHDATTAHAGFIGPITTTDRQPYGTNPRPDAVVGGGAPWATGVAVIMRAMGIRRDFSRSTDRPSDEVRGGMFNPLINSAHETSHNPSYRPGSQSSPIARGVTNRQPVGGGRVHASGNPQRPAWYPVEHAATAAVRGAFATDFTDAHNGGNPRAIGALAVARAHGDRATTRITGNQYRVQPSLVAGEGADPRDMPETLGYSAPFTGRMLAKNGNDGFSVGDDTPAGGEFQTHYHTGGTHARQWFRMRYSSPTLGAMYSTNPLRGVLPNTVATPFPQGGTIGYKGSDIPPNSRPVFPRFATPTMFRTPASERDTITAVADGAGIANTMGLGI
jgi:hypothetical protein